MSCTSRRKVRTVPTSARLARDHAEGAQVAGLHRAQADHRAVDRADVARHEALHRGDDVRRHQHRVDRQVGVRAMAAAAVHDDLDAVGRRHHRPRVDADRARPAAPASCASRRPTRPGSARTGRRRSSPWRRQSLLRRAGRSAPRCRRSRASRPGSAPRRPASWCGRRGRSRASGRGVAERQAKSFSSIIGSASMSARRPIMRADCARAAADHADHAGLADASWISSTPASAQRLDHARGGATLLEAELGVRVQVAPERRQLAVPARPGAGRRRRAWLANGLRHISALPSPARRAGADRRRSTAGRRPG